MSALPTDVLDSLASGILVIDRESRVLFLNRALADLLGLNRNDWAGRRAAELATLIEPRLSSPRDFRTSVDASLDPEGIRSQEQELSVGDEVVHLREDSGPLRDEFGEVVGRLLAYHDISREKAIDRMKTDFIAVASHELRTPMTSIKGSIDLILSGFAGEISADSQELLEIAQKSCDRLVRLINDILDLAKIEAGQMKLKPVRMDLTDAVERSIRSVKSLADQSEIRLKLERAENLPAVEADRDRIEQVVTNLLSNAIKYSPANAEVRVELRAENGWVQCSVIDQGCGIPEEDLVRVFGKFEQVGDARRKGGTGLGLAITQALVNEHKGRIWVESRLNQGSKFVFRLPAASGSNSD